MPLAFGPNGFYGDTSGAGGFLKRALSTGSGFMPGMTMVCQYLLHLLYLARDSTRQVFGYLIIFLSLFVFLVILGLVLRSMRRRRRELAAATVRFSGEELLNQRYTALNDPPKMSNVLVMDEKWDIEYGGWEELQVSKYNIIGIRVVSSFLGQPLAVTSSDHGIPKRSRPPKVLVEELQSHARSPFHLRLPGSSDKPTVVLATPLPPPFPEQVQVSFFVAMPSPLRTSRSLTVKDPVSMSTDWHEREFAIGTRTLRLPRSTR
jgi:hypothetical protein